MLGVLFFVFGTDGGILDKAAGTFSMPTDSDQKLVAGALSAKLVRALVVLLESVVYAESTTHDRWDYAVEIQYLRRAGLSNNDLRYLVALKYIEHSSETAGNFKTRRTFEATSQWHFTEQTCFVLTQAGMNAAKRCLKRHKLQQRQNRVNGFPLWDAAGRVLIFGGKLVKQFKSPATNQESILSAFQEEGWPKRVDDPLSPEPQIDSKRRLAETIKSLNSHQSHVLIHFHGDGTGQGIIWQSLPAGARLSC